MKNNQIKILAIETSCDETAAAVIGVKNNQPIILSSIVSSQVDLHAKTGGVVPEVASRAHMEAIIPVIAEALLQADWEDGTTGFKPQALNYSDAIEILQKEIDYIAVTAGPGLIGSLLVGFNAAKSIAYAGDLPVVPVNHIEGHIYSAFAGLAAEMEFPILALTVSGGHTSLTLMKDHGEYENIGQTLDDAAGEAFDKVAKLLGLGYPGGPAVSKLANQFRAKSEIRNPKFETNPNSLNSKIKKDTTIENWKLETGNSPKGLVFPRPILNDGTFNFSFSGLKTAVLQYVLNVRKEHELTEENKLEICAAFEDAVVDVLVTKALRAAKKHEPKAVILAGGVAANKQLRTKLESAIRHTESDIQFYVPDIKLCGDNAAMIGLAAFYHVQKGNISSWDKIKVDSNLEL